MSFEYLGDKRANLCLADLAIDTRHVRYVSNHDKILVVLGLVHQEFRRESEVPTVGSSDGREFRQWSGVSTSHA